MTVTNLQSLVHRVDDTTSTIPNPFGVPVTLFANRDVPIELEAVEQVLGFVSLQGTIGEIATRERAGTIAPFWARRRAACSALLARRRGQCSACHGAGRSLSRGKSRHIDDKQYRDTFDRLRVVTPIDPTAPDVPLRRDVLAEYHDRLKEEAPYAYKDITPVVQTVWACPDDQGLTRL